MQSNLTRIGDIFPRGIDFALQTIIISFAAKAKSKVMSLFRKLFVIFMSLCAVLPYGARAELQLETWKVYGQMAEQSAICASFSKLMEAQSVLNPDLGALWMERRKFAGAVIRKAVLMELNRESSEAEINNLIARYRDWVLSSLMINNEKKSHESNGIKEESKAGAHKISVLMSSQCKNLFQQGDEIIRNRRPDLAYLLQNASETQVRSKNSPIEEKTSVVKVRPRDSLSTKNPVIKADPTVNQEPSSADKALKLSIGGGGNLILNLPGQKSSSSSEEAIRAVSNHAEKKTKFLNGSLPTKLVQISGPAPRPDQGQIKKTAASSGLHVKSQSAKVELSVEKLYDLLEQQEEASTNLIVPRQSANKQHEKKYDNYFAQLGAFAQLENAKAEKIYLETKFSALFEKLPLYVAEITDSGPRFYRIQTSNLSRRHIKTLCDMMWPHKISCLAKR